MVVRAGEFIPVFAYGVVAEFESSMSQSFEEYLKIVLGDCNGVMFERKSKPTVLAMHACFVVASDGPFSCIRKSAVAAHPARESKKASGISTVERKLTIR